MNLSKSPHTEVDSMYEPSFAQRI